HARAGFGELAAACVQPGLRAFARGLLLRERDGRAEGVDGRYQVPRGRAAAADVEQRAGRAPQLQAFIELRASLREATLAEQAPAFAKQLRRAFVVVAALRQLLGSEWAWREQERERGSDEPATRRGA